MTSEIITTNSIVVPTTGKVTLIIDGRETGNDVLGNSTNKEEMLQIAAGLLGLGDLTLIQTGNFSKESTIHDGGIAEDNFAVWEITSSNTGLALSIINSMVFTGTDPINPAIDFSITNWGSDKDGILSVLTTSEWDLNGVDLSSFNANLLVIQLADRSLPTLPSMDKLHIRTWKDVHLMRENSTPLINWRINP
jgi:hypothetical protein